MAKQAYREYRGLDLVTIIEEYKRLQTIGATGISLHTLRRWVNENRIPSIQVGNRKLISHDDVAEFIDKLKYGNQ